MKFLGLPFVCLFLTLLIHCNAISVGQLDLINIGDIGKKVKVLFSPNVFEAYSYTLDRMANVVNNPKFKKDRPTVIYIHGWLEDGEFEESVMAVRSAYREKNDHNILVIDWSLYSRWMLPVPYHTSITKLKDLCEMIAEQLELIRTRGHSFYRNFYIVGHSLGGECAGLVGRTLKKISSGQFELSKIYALDPAGPGFEFNAVLGVSGFNTITKNDAAYVQAIHTNGGRLGVKNAVGHSDFFVNGGSEQPGCTLDICHHQRSWIYFQESVREDGIYLARRCDSYYDFLNGYCDSNEIAYMGYSSNETLPVGTYYLRTHPSRYGTPMGMDGLRSTKFTLTDEEGKASVGLKPFSVEAKLINNLNLDKYMNSFNNGL